MKHMVSLMRLGLLLWLLLLSACSYRLNTKQVAAEIKADIERQGKRVSLKSVTCPGNVSRQAETYFRCVGELPTGEIFTIHVTQQDDQGTVTWEVPSSKALINLVVLEETMQKTLAKDLGKRFPIDCGEAYRVNHKGDTFECDVVGGVMVGTDQIESVLVKIDAEGNLKWQEVRQPVFPTQPIGPETTASDANSPPESTIPAQESSPQPMPQTAAQTAVSTVQAPLDAAAQTEGTHDN
jgi:hypothetical protein